MGDLTGSQRVRLIVLTGAAGLLVAGALFFVVRSVERRHAASEFQRRADAPAMAVQRVLAEHLHLLQSLEAFYFSSREVDRREFWGFTRDALARLGAIESVEWIPQVTAAARNRHEQACRLEGWPLYQVQDRDVLGRWVRAPARLVYYPVAYAEPASRRPDLGLDLATSPDNNLAMARARDATWPVAGAPFPRLEGTNLAYRCRFFAAVFTNLVSHDTLEQRRRHLAGFAAVVIDLNRLMHVAVGQVNPHDRDGLAWLLQDERARGSAPLRLYQSAGWTVAARAGLETQAVSRWDVGGRTWVLRCRPLNDESMSMGMARSWGVLAGSLLVTGLVVAFLSAMLGRAAQVEQLVLQRTTALEQASLEMRQEMARRHATEAALGQEQDLIAALLDTIPDHIYFKDQESRFLRINRAMADRFKLHSPDEAVGRTDFDFFLADHAQRAFADEQEILRTGQPLIGREECETWPDGSTSWVSTTKHCLRDKAGQVVGTFGISRDITLRKQAEQELAEKAHELERSNRELEQFAYIASHDLQEPLRMISSYTQLLGRRYADHLDQDAQEFIRFAVEGSARMQALINDLLAYSRVGTRGRAFQAVESDKVVQRALKNLEVAIEETHARISCPPLPTVLGDPTQLTQVFQNLIGNAIKFHGPSVPVIDIAARAVLEGKSATWEFTVRDQGIGIEPQYFEKIFVIFQRLHSRDEYPGTGIGLALCKKIVERHGGRIWVESKPGAGASFHFVLPAG